MYYFIFSRNHDEKCQCVDGNASDVKSFTGNEQYWCCKAPNTECTDGRCQGKKLHLSKQCHDDTKIKVYTKSGVSSMITHPRCNQYPSSTRGYRGSRPFLDVCRDNRYDLNLAKYIQAKVVPIIRNFIWVKMAIF